MNILNPKLDPKLQAHDRDHDAEVAPAAGKLYLNPADYPGGIAIWGALNAIYDTSVFPREDGVHVHARRTVGGPKQIDQTYTSVEVPLPKGGSFTILGEDGTNYNLATILGRKLTYLFCPDCGEVHRESDAYAVHYHTEHACQECGARWETETPCISNPIMLLKEMVGDSQQNREIVDPLDRTVKVDQTLWKGGVQLWGSNPAIIWTSPKLEEGGIHVHACRSPGVIGVDETFGTVTLDGVWLDPSQVRLLMAQDAAPYLKDHVASLDCPNCERPHFDRGTLAIVPHSRHTCESCGAVFTSDLPRIANPMVKILEAARKRHATLGIPNCRVCKSQLSSRLS